MGKKFTGLFFFSALFLCSTLILKVKTSNQIIRTPAEDRLNLLNENFSALRGLLGIRESASRLTEEEQIAFIENYFRTLVQEEIPNDRMGAPATLLIDYLKSHRNRLKNDIENLTELLSKPWSRKCCEQDTRALLSEKQNLKLRVSNAIISVKENSDLFERKIPIQALSSLSETVDGVEYIPMSETEKFDWLMTVYLPTLLNMNLTEEEIAQSIIDGEALPPTLHVKQLVVLDTDNPLTKRSAPYISPTTLCSFNHRPVNEMSPDQLWSNLCNGHESDDRVNCTEHHQIFSQYFDIPAVTASEGVFEKRVDSITIPKRQSKTDACVGMAFSQELNLLSEKQGLFLGSFFMEVDGLQLYNQMKEPISTVCLYEDNHADEFMRARENSGGLYIPEAIDRILDDPACLHQRDSRLSVNKVSTLLVKRPLSDYPFSFFESLISAGYGAAVSIYTERGFEQEDWFQYGCESSLMHEAYLIGVGRGVSPFPSSTRSFSFDTDIAEPIEYVILRDSFRTKEREYKVPFDNFLRYLNGIHKFHEVSFIPSN